MDEETLRRAVPEMRELLDCLGTAHRPLTDDEIVYALRTRGRTLLDALGHSVNCVSPDHYRKVWQEERERAESAEAHMRVGDGLRREAEDRAERAERERDEIRNRFERLADDAANWPFGKDGHLWQMHEKHDFARWLRNRAALSADAEPPSSLCGWCGNRHVGRCQEYIDQVEEPSRAEGDEQPQSLNELSDEWGLCRPPCTKPAGHEWECDADAMPGREGDDGRSRAIEAAANALLVGRDGISAIESHAFRLARTMVDAALASGGVVEIDRAAEVVDHNCAETHQQIARWTTDGFREAEARVRELEAALREAVGALEQHRRDMHQRSPRPCATCTRSENAIHRAGHVLGKGDSDA